MRPGMGAKGLGLAIAFRVVRDGLIFSKHAQFVWKQLPTSAVALSDDAVLATVNKPLFIYVRDCLRAVVRHIAA
jgi:hypothetical protein